eukprot:sb/3474591/
MSSRQTIGTDKSRQPIRTRYLGDVSLGGDREPTETRKQPIKTRCLNHVTGYQQIRNHGPDERTAMNGNYSSIYSRVPVYLVVIVFIPPPGWIDSPDQQDSSPAVKFQQDATSVPQFPKAEKIIQSIKLDRFSISE